MTPRVMGTAALGVTPFCASTAMARGTRSEGHFTIYGDTARNIFVRFYTDDGRGWSGNRHTTDALMSGASALTEPGACPVPANRSSPLSANRSEMIDVCDGSNACLADNKITCD